jgi:hypothetical protein
MPDPELGIDEAYKLLISWSESLLHEVKASQAEMLSIFDTSTKLPADCPSRASMAQLVLRGVKEKLFEVSGALVIVEAAIRKSGDRSAP